MKTKFCFYSQRNYPHPRTAIEAEILFAARIMQVRFLKLVSGKTPREQNSSGKKIGAQSAVPILVYLCIVLIVHKYRQSAKSITIRIARNTVPEVFPLTIGSGKTMPFEKRRSRYKETGKKVPQAYRVYVEDTFFPCDAVDARIFSKGEETGVNYYGARYLDPKYSRWLSGDPALGEYIPKAPIDDEAKKHNENLPGMGGVFNVVNLHLYHYAGNNPVKYTDPDGEKLFDSRWWSRNWDNLVSLGLNAFEVVAGASIATATGVTGAGAFMGSLMVTHGSANSIATLGKIIATSLAAEMHGDDYADKLDASMPDTALGFIGYGLGLMADAIIGDASYDNGKMTEKIGALGDFVDIACGIAISSNAGKNLNNAITSFMKSSGKYLSKTDFLKLQKYLQMTHKVNAAKIVEGIVENYDRFTSLKDNMKQLVE